MKKNLFRIVMLIMSVLPIVSFESAFARTDKYRLTLRTDPSTSAVIGWNQVSGSDAIVYYGTTDYGTNYSAYPNKKTVDYAVTAKGMNNRFARLTGLQPNTAYYFVIRDADGTSKRFWLKTLPNDPSQRLSIIAGGDSRNNRTPRQNGNKMVAKLRPHAVLFGGDMTDTGTDAQWAEWFEDWQLTIAADGRMFPVIAARGNHEGSNYDIAYLFDVPSTRVYYALNLGGSLIRAYTLNTESSIAGTQTTWLSNDLAENANVTWKMAQYHRPMRPHASYKSEGNDQYNNWAPLFQQHNVKLVVESDAHTVKTTWPVIPSTGSGSDEGFVRDDEKGTVYVGEGCWGAPLRQADDNKTWTRNSGMFNHFNWIFVDQEKIEIRTVNIDNAPTVGTLTDATMFTMPSGINIWTPSNGALIAIKKAGSGTLTGTPTSDPALSASRITSKISAGANDVEESQSGSMYTGSTDLELVNDGSTQGNQTLGLRFTGINLPQGATITNAYIQFTADEAGSTATNLTIKGENVDNSAAFASASYNVSSRIKTSATVPWVPSAWSTAGSAGTTERTPNLATIVQQVVSRSGWAAGNALSFIITGTGKRTAYAYEGSSSLAPTLVIEYSSPAAATVTVSNRINSGSNDVEQTQNGGLYTSSSDIELVNDGATNGNQTIGLRFTSMGIPKGAVITGAYVQFVAQEVGSSTANLVVRGENADNSLAFASATNNVSNRAKTTSYVNWAPPAWSTVGSVQRTPDITAVVQGIVDRSGWASGNAMTIMITGTGTRTAYAYEGSPTLAPMLVVQYSSTAGAKIAAEEETGVSTIELVEATPPEMQTYPNPVVDVLNIKINAHRAPDDKLTIDVYDISGKLCLRRKEEWIKDESIQLQTHTLSAGTYIVVTEYNNERLLQKIVKF